jgi:hypothetical protein
LMRGVLFHLLLPGVNMSLRRHGDAVRKVSIGS